MRRWRLLVLGGLLLASPAAAQTIQGVPPGGLLTLTSAQSSTGASTNAIDTKTGYFAAAFVYCVTGGTATVKTQMSPDRGSSWVDVVNSGKSIDSGGTACDGVGLDFPAGVYRTNVTAQTGSVTTKALIGARLP